MLAFWPFAAFVARMEGNTCKVSKLFNLIDLYEMYQIIPRLFQSDLAFRFYAPKTFHFLDPQV